MGGDTLGRRAAVGEELRRAFVTSSRSGLAQVRVHGSPQNGVDECQRPVRAQDVRPDEPRRRCARFVGLSSASAAASASSDSSPRIATARASASAGGPSRRSRCRTKRETDSGPSSRTRAAALGARLDPLDEDRVHELVEQKGIASAGGVDRLQEQRRWVARESRPEQLRHRLEAERCRTHERRERLRLQLGEDRFVHAGLSRPNAGCKDDRKPVESASKVGKEAQRRRVAPVEVVDREQDRRELGEVRSQPEEPVQRSVGSVLAAGRCFAGVLELEEWSSQVGRAVEEPCALVLAGCDQTRLEQLADDPVGEVALELTPASAQHLEPESVRALARGAEQT